MKLNKITLKGDAELADDIADLLAKFSSQNSIQYTIDFQEVDIVMEIWTETRCDFVELDQLIERLKQENCGLVTLEVE